MGVDTRTQVILPFLLIMEGIFIPMEFQELEGLTNTESMVLAIYKYYTEKGNLHYCSLRNEDICKMVRLKNESNLIRIKKHLKELGYIRTDGGIKVTYIGVKGDIEVSPGVTYKSVNPDIEVTPPRHISQSGVTYKSVKGDIEVTHKKEKKKKRNKKEEKKEMTNFEKLVELLPVDCKTQEKIDYIKKKYESRINSLDIGSDAMNTWVMNIKLELTDYKTPIKKEDKKEEMSNTIDLFF